MSQVQGLVRIIASAIMAPMRKLLDALYLGCGALAAVFLGGICVLMLSQAILREFDVMIRGADDLTAWFCAASAFLALPHTFKYGDLVRVGLLLDALSERVRRYFEIFSLGVATWFVGYMTYAVGSYVLESWQLNEVAQGLIKVPLWIPQLSFLAGSAVFLVAIIDELILVLRRRKPTYRIAEEERLARGDFSESV
jgi:TRAP-type C4-dicarboxylate transport system permease small subunit